MEGGAWLSSGLRDLCRQRLNLVSLVAQTCPAGHRLTPLYGRSQSLRLLIVALELLRDHPPRGRGLCVL